MPTATLPLSLPAAEGACDMTSTTAGDAALRDAALTGHPAALRQLEAMRTPVVQAKVARALLAGGRTSHHRNIREEVRDLSQEIFAVLFAEQGKVLRAWDPDHGVSLKGFVGVVATRRTISLLRTAKRNPWTEDPTDCADLARLRAAGPAERHVVARDLLDKATAHVRDGLTPKGRVVFDLLIVEDASNDEVAEATGLSRASIYQWRSRVMKSLRNHLRALGGDAQ